MGRPLIKPFAGPAIVALAAILGAAGVVAGAGGIRASAAIANTPAGGLVTQDRLSDTLSPPVRSAVANTVEVVATSSCKTEIGSAWSFAPGYFATNAHVVAGSSALDIATPDGGLDPATLVLFDPLHDIAVLMTGATSVQPLVLAQTSSPGESVYTVGYPRGREAIDPATLSSQRTKILPNIAEPGSSAEVIDAFQGNTTFGSSGGPLIDTTGAVVGMVTGQEIDPTGIVLDGFALDLSQIQRDLTLSANLRSPVSSGACA